MRQTFKYQLHEVALPLSVGALGAWAGGAASDQAGVLDLVRQAVCDHRVVCVDERSKPVIVPQQEALPASFVLGLQDKAHARIVALVLDAAETSPAALEAYPPGFAHTHAVEGAVGAGGKRLGEHRIQVVGEPRDPQLLREVVKGIFGKAVLLSQGRKGGFPLLRVSPGYGAGRPAWAGSARMRRSRRCPSESTAL